MYPPPEFAVETTSPPAGAAVLLSAVMAHCKAEVADDAPLFAEWVRAATELVETQTGLRLLSQSVEVTFESFPECGRPLVLPVRPMQSVTSVSYRDAAGDEQTLTGFATWRAKGLIGKPVAGWPATICDGMAAVTVTAVVGWASPAAIPAQALQAVKLICGYWNSFRGDGKEPNQYPQLVGIPAGAQRLIDQLTRREYR